MYFRYSSMLAFIFRIWILIRWHPPASFFLQKSGAAASCATPLNKEELCLRRNGGTIYEICPCGDTLCLTLNGKDYRQQYNHIFWKFLTVLPKTSDKVAFLTRRKHETTMRGNERSHQACSKRNGCVPGCR